MKKPTWGERATTYLERAASVKVLPDPAKKKHLQWALDTGGNIDSVRPSQHGEDDEASNDRLGSRTWQAG